MAIEIACNGYLEQNTKEQIDICYILYLLQETETTQVIVKQ